MNSSPRLSRGSTLSLLELHGVGPARKLGIELADRVNLITGDNGLGKTFILECAWWALTRSWSGNPVYPRQDAARDEPEMLFHISYAPGEWETNVWRYNWTSQDWSLSQGQHEGIPGLVIYARADGAFAVWDAVRQQAVASRGEGLEPFIFASNHIWDGLGEKIGAKTVQRCNGLIYDWVLWQSNPGAYPFETLEKVLRRLSPPDLHQGDLGPLEPGKPTRIPGGESRLIPTIKHAYGEEPLVYASAAVRRIVALAYLIVWTWEEHKAQAKISREEPQNRLVILVDEIEAHLHPQWQRVILPALLAVQEDLGEDLETQLLITTHSPLVLASVEPFFDEEKDRLFRFDLQDRQKVVLAQVPWSKQGDAVGWLTSDAFGLRQALRLLRC